MAEREHLKTEKYFTDWPEPVETPEPPDEGCADAVKAWKALHKDCKHEKAIVITYISPETGCLRRATFCENCGHVFRASAVEAKSIQVAPTRRNGDTEMT